ncbi:hypothetical protein MSG28_004423 [Choristoneura fumiferana]|uniref:Uncharacterized protein n=1 Tax=Choristoneura fumiferana TaxID=7141 RepID=A0ACC0K658_CHOFU|nr:hypothetical protein MSG28_004423 [Choristoneura fumiferana]
MSLPLWTPYAESEALDLTKPHIKKERVSPPPVVQQSPYHQHSPDHAPFAAAASPRHYIPYLHASPVYGTSQAATRNQQEESRYVQNHCSSLDMVHQPSTSTQYYRYPTPAPQISPPSSNYSNCDDAVYPKAATLSPPESPPADKLLKPDALEDNEDFLAFERNAMRAMALKNGGSLLGNNPRMRRTVHSTSQNAADDAYKTQRQRNNFAAKQSRDRRKLREIHLALKVTYLSNTVAKLKAQLAGRYCGGCQRPCGSPK